jgi:predicted phosphoribosyltransferase
MSAVGRLREFRAAEVVLDEVRRNRRQLRPHKPVAQGSERLVLDVRSGHITGHTMIGIDRLRSLHSRHQQTNVERPQRVDCAIHRLTQQTFGQL